MRSQTLLSFLFATALLAEKTPMPKPDIPAKTAFRNQAAGSAPAASDPEWWKAFNDPLLDELMAKATTANLDIRKAGSRLAEANANRSNTKSALLPSIDGTNSTTQTRGGFNQGIVHVASGSSLISPFETGLISGGFNMRWELDVFGGLRKSLKAASFDAKAAEEYLGDVRVMVRAEVARNYVEMRGLESQIAVVKANFDSEKDLLDLIRSRAEAGLATDLDVERQIAQLASIHAVIPDLDSQRLQAAHRIAVLLGEDPTALVDRLEASSSKPLITPAAPLAIPSEVLKRRPDVRRAEAQISAAYARAGSARADLYPKFVITGLSGRQATDVSGLTLGGGNFFSVGPGITLPIFNGGRIRSRIAVQDAQLQEAVRSYEQDVLGAFEETENAFVARDRAEQRQKDLETGLVSAKRSIDLSQDLYVHGLADFLTVLDAQRQRFQLEKDLAANQTVILRSTIALHKAIGE